jgi:acetamidase/formamidase
MATHHFAPNALTLHGSFTRDITPIAIIDPGDRVIYETLDASWIKKFDVSLRRPPEKRADLGEYWRPRESPRDDGHALIGPIAIRDAIPGKMLAIRVNRIIPGRWGWVSPWFGTPKEEKNNVPVFLWRLDAERMVGRNSFGQTVALEPFMGVMGMPIDQYGFQSTTPPRLTGGNIDCKELVAGSTLYLPIDIKGGLFSVGDGHARQGDGETGGTAIECPMELVDLTFDVIDKPIISTPYANTPKGWVTFGFDEDLQVAHDKALLAMQNFVMKFYRVDEMAALGLMGVVVDFHITQTVNTVQGVHAILPHGALR